MTTYVLRNGKLVEKHLAPPLNGHYVQSDNIDVESPVTGEGFTSKARYYDHLRAHGCHVKEAGDVGEKRRVRSVREDVKRSLQQMGVVG